MHRTAIDAVFDRVRSTLDAVEPQFPLYADLETGTWETTKDGNWCPGHWIGLLWLTSCYADGGSDSRYRRAARSYTNEAGWGALRCSLFAGMNYRYAGFRAADISQDAAHTAFGLRGATHVLATLDETAGVVPVGSFATRGLERHSAATTEGVAAVDAVYTAVSPLWRAAAVTDDDRYRRAARRHTDTHLSWFLRDDGAVWHKVAYEPSTGSPETRFNQLTQVSDTCWARGLGWSVAGLVDAYNATGDPSYLEAIQSHIDYYRRWTPDDDVCFSEIGPDGCERYRDTSGAVLTAYGLVRLSGDDPATASLRAYGHDILASLVNEYLVRTGHTRGQLRSGCYNAVDDVAPSHELIWSLYYFLFALLVTAMDGCHAKPAIPDDDANTYE